MKVVSLSRDRALLKELVFILIQRFKKLSVNLLLMEMRREDVPEKGDLNYLTARLLKTDDEVYLDNDYIRLLSLREWPKETGWYPLKEDADERGIDIVLFVLEGFNKPVGYQWFSKYRKGKQESKPD